MKPHLKLTSISFGLSTAIVFALWTFINKIGIENSYLIIISGLLISLGLYRIISTSIIYLISNCTWLKKKFLGPYFLEGTWCGFYIGANDNVRYFLERFEQNIDGLKIRGKSFNEKMEYHSIWTSTSVNIDIENAKISYLYDVTGINDISNNNGIAFFNFDRKDSNSAANKLTGFSADYHIGKRVKSMEIKVSDKCGFDEEQSIKNAKELYEQYKDIF